MKNILLKHLLFTRRSSPNTSQSGFSLIELTLITVIIGVLSAIAAAGWNSFTTRQRIRAVNDQVFQVLRSAQSDAKLKKKNVTVAFNVANNNYDGKPTIKAGDNPVQILGGSEVKANQIKMAILNDEGSKLTIKANKADPDGASITFNYLGSIVEDANSPKIPLYITVTHPEDKGTSSLSRCVILETLLGGMRSAKGSTILITEPNKCLMDPS